MCVCWQLRLNDGTLLKAWKKNATRKIIWFHSYRILRRQLGVDTKIDWNVFGPPCNSKITKKNPTVSHSFLTICLKSKYIGSCVYHLLSSWPSFCLHHLLSVFILHSVVVFRFCYRSVVTPFCAFSLNTFHLFAKKHFHNKDSTHKTRSRHTQII